MTAAAFESLSPVRLRARVSVYAFDPKRDEPRHEVKAATYHQFEIKKGKSGWRARVIFDI